MNTDTLWFTNIRHWSSLSKLLLFNNHGHWQVKPCRFSLNPAQALCCSCQLAWLGLPILKQPTCRQTGTYTLPQFPDESGLLLIPPRWCSHFPVAVMAAACWGFSALMVQHHWMKTRRKSWQNPTLLLRAWLLPGSLVLAVSSMWLLTAWLFHGLAWKELATALVQETGWFVNQGTLEIWEMGEYFHLHQREAES